MRRQPGADRALLPVLANRVDVYLCGHDHNLQALQPRAGVHFLVAGGGGGRTYELKEYARSVIRAKAHGFAVLEVDGQALTMRLFDKTRKQLYEQKLTKRPGAGSAYGLRRPSSAPRAGDHRTVHALVSSGHAQNLVDGVK